jgi:hypothetical protein
MGGLTSRGLVRVSLRAMTDEHVIEIIEVEHAKLYGHPTVTARCTCGWQAGPHGGRHGAEYAEADGDAHLRDVREQ